MSHHIASTSACHDRISSVSSSSFFVSSINASAAGSAHDDACESSPPAADGHGLVSFSTSGQAAGGGFPKILVDSDKARLSRMSSGVLTATRLIDASCTSEKRRFHRYMVTLTYRPGVFWSARHISNTIRFYRRWAAKMGFSLSYVWVAEIQEGRWLRGGSLLGECVHYHLLLWVPARFVPPMADKQGWWSYGMSNRVRVSRPIKYMMKYASKGQSVEFPKGLRIHGCGGLVESARDERRWWLMPRWVRSVFSILDRPFRCPGGGIVSRKTGEWLPSIWRVSFESSRIFVSLRDDILDFFSVGRVFHLIEGGVI